MIDLDDSIKLIEQYREEIKPSIIRNSTFCTNPSSSQNHQFGAVHSKNK
jgi:hypothetical protein